MDEKTKQALFLVVVLGGGAIIVNIPWERVSDDIRSVLSATILPLFLSGLAAWLLYQRKKILDLRNRCHVKVTAECVNTQYNHHYWARGRFVTAFYSYEYNGMRYTGCNNVDIGAGTRGVIKPGDMTEIYINPDCLPDDLYDPIAEMSAKANLNTAYMILILSALILVLPLIFRVFLKGMTLFM